MRAAARHSKHRCGRRGSRTGAHTRVHSLAETCAVWSERVAQLLSKNRDRFRQWAEHDSSEDLVTGALLLAAEEYPDLDVNACLFDMERMGEGARNAVSSFEAPRERVEALASYFSETLGFRGNQKDYYDPKNSFLNDVLARKLGIPITLSVVFMELGRRAGVPLVGVAFPAHFLVRHAVERELFVDVFNDGRLMSPQDLANFLFDLTNGRVRFESSFVEPVDPKQIVRRMLMNLAGLYRARGENLKALDAVDRIVILDPENPEVYRDRAMMYLELQAYPFAAADLESFRDRTVDAEERHVIGRLLAEVCSRSCILH